MVEEQKGSMMPILFLAIFGIIGIGAVIYFLTQRAKGEEKPSEGAPEQPTPTPEAGKGGMAVRVKYTTGSVIQGAEVRIFKMPEDAYITGGLTDNRGTYVATDLEPGDYRVRMYYRGVEQYQDVTVVANTSAFVEFVLEIPKAEIGYKIDVIPDPFRYYTGLRFDIEGTIVDTIIDKKEKIVAEVTGSASFTLYNIDDYGRILKELGKFPIQYGKVNLASITESQLVRRKPVE